MIQIYLKRFYIIWDKHHQHSWHPLSLGCWGLEITITYLQIDKFYDMMENIT
jgi:hypothetical protein